MEGFLFLCFLCFLYFLPSLIGMRKRDAAAIFALNFFLGWTGIGWVFALVVALMPEHRGAAQGWRCGRCESVLNQKAAFCHACGSRIGWTSTHATPV
ncbi:MAG TPA: superinfection immunity protein [Bryobacteraceae bacterium]|jgi:hypothetical protein|nr:superinfection immunity protein [Bryobacteraceae bacterium]